MNRTDTFLQEIRSELCDNILPFWLGKTPDPLEGGFLGRISGTGEIDRKAPRGVILPSPRPTRRSAKKIT